MYSTEHPGFPHIYLPHTVYYPADAISYHNGSIEYPYFFLSSSIDNAPASCIASFGLSPVVLTVIPVLSWVRYEQVRERFRSVANRIMVIAAFTSAIGAHGVASFQAHNGLPIHLLFAALFFGGGCVVTLAVITTDYYCQDFGTKSMRALRKLLATCVSVQLLVMCYIGWFKVMQDPCFGDVDNPCNEGEGDWDDYNRWQFINAVLEVSVFACLLSTYVTFVPELKGWSVVVTIKRESELLLPPGKSSTSI